MLKNLLLLKNPPIITFEIGCVDAFSNEFKTYFKYNGEMTKELIVPLTTLIVKLGGGDYEKIRR